MSALIQGGPTNIGIEVVQMQATLAVASRLSAELSIQEAVWMTPDRQLAAALKQAYRPLKLESPPDGCIYSGSRLGILGMPVDKFPAVGVMVDQATPAAESLLFDQSTHVYAPRLYIEAVLRSDEFNVDDVASRIEQEGAIDKRCKRYIEAIVACIQRDPTLGGVIPELPAPTVEQTDAFVREGEVAGEQGRQRVFSLVRVQYTATAYAARLDTTEPPSIPLPSGFGA